MANGQLEQATLWAKQSTKEFSHSPCIGLSQQPCKVNDNSFVPTYEPVKTSSKADTSKNAFDKGASRSFALSSTHMYHYKYIKRQIRLSQRIESEFEASNHSAYWPPGRNFDPTFRSIVAPPILRFFKPLVRFVDNRLLWSTVNIVL